MEALTAAYTYSKGIKSLGHCSLWQLERSGMKYGLQHEMSNFEKAKDGEV